MPTEPYARGTKTTRKTTATLTPGDVVLTDPDRRADDQRLASSKTGSFLRTVAGVAPFYAPAYRQRRYKITFDDGTTTGPDGYAGAQTWPLVVK